MSTETITTTAVSTKETPLQKVARLLKNYTEAARQVAEIKENAAKGMKPLTEAMEAAFFEIKTLADKHRGKLFGDAKKLGLEFGDLGYKLLDKKLVLPEGLNEKWFLQTIKESAPGAMEEKVNDKKLVAALAAMPDLSAAFTKRGIKVEQNECFYVTPKKAVKSAD
jgi:hypothetical protein